MYNQNNPKKIEISWQDVPWIIEKADKILNMPILHITDTKNPHSAGSIHDYSSVGDYWWKNPDTENGLPYVRRDGESNPENFQSHRVALRNMRTNVAFLTAAYVNTKNEIYSKRAVQILKEFFLDEKTYMSPNLNYSQAIPGVCDGRGIGIIDTLHMVDVVFAINALEKSSYMTDDILCGLKNWFSKYIEWMMNDPKGIDEMNTVNNHSICYFVQLAAFALFTQNDEVLDFCRTRYKKTLIYQQDLDGSFPQELSRTKPYGYLFFTVDNMVSLCEILSTKDDNLWEFETDDGRSISKGIDFILPYLIDKKTWPYREDIEHFEAYPARASFMLFAGSALGKKNLISLYDSLPLESNDQEARRNIAVRVPHLWFM